MNAAAQAGHFDALFRLAADPWRTRTRWYEARKRALTLAALPQARYGRAYEPGCGAGETTAALAGRCDQVLASDASEAAVRHARWRVASMANVRVVEARTPQDWPPGRFDLVVIGELGYYLAADDLRRLAECCTTSLTEAGTLVAVHWRRPEPDLLRLAEDVHAALRGSCGLHAASHYEDDDFLLDVWTADARSVAQREGLA